MCQFNNGSKAIGCLVHLRNIATNETYCRVVGRYQNTQLNESLCQSSSSNGLLCTGVYSVDVYDINSDSSVSLLPAINGDTVSLFGAEGMDEIEMHGDVSQVSLNATT